MAEISSFVISRSPTTGSGRRTSFQSVSLPCVKSMTRGMAVPRSGKLSTPASIGHAARPGLSLRSRGSREPGPGKGWVLMGRGGKPDCTREAPAPRVAPWDRGGVRSDDGWNRCYSHLSAATFPADPRGVNWACRCPACGASFLTTFGTEADAAVPDVVTA